MANMNDINPFTPVFGRIPPFMAGRELLIADLDKAFDSAGADPNLSSIFVGARGTGKTALLTYLSKDAEASGWVVANVSAKPGMLEEIYEQSQLKGAHLLESKPKRKLKSLSIGQFVGAEWENESNEQGSWRMRMSRLINELNDFGSGLLITVDEVDPSIEEMVELASVYQHFVREEMKVGLLLAGLPSKVSSLVSSDTVSFLRRARTHRLKRISDEEAKIALTTTLAQGQRSLEGDALTNAVKAIDGFPYLLQLMGFYLWEESAPGMPLDELASSNAANRAMADFTHGVLDSTYRELSRGDLEFLAAMLDDDGPSLLKDITERTGKTASSTRVYKRRLLEAGVIEEERRGEVRFELPMFKEYLRDKL